MKLWATALAALLCGSAVLPAAAQTSTPPAPSPAAETAAVDVSRLPLNLGRIGKQLQRTSEREAHDGLNLQYFVDVYGKAPQIELFTAAEKNSLSSPTPWGTPTHKDMLDLVTPKEFRSPPMDFNALMRWFQEKVAK